jgi:hypothetical protein
MTDVQNAVPRNGQDMPSEQTVRGRAKAALALALGVAPGDGVRCVLCGPSQFASAGLASKTLGIGFGEWDACDDPTAPDLCTGCARLMAGRPGSTPRPLRDTTVAVLNGELVRPDVATVWAWLVAPPAGLTVLSWAISKQRHHVLYAGFSTPTRLLVGSDAGTIVVRPRDDHGLIAALLTLRSGPEPKKPWCSRDEVLSGRYRATTIARDPARWAAADTVLAGRRGDPALALYVAHAPVLPDPPTLHQDDQSMPNPVDAQATALLAALAKSSAYRSRDGLEFWNGLYARRVARHIGRPLPVFVSRMLADLQTPPTSDGATEALALLAAWDDQTQAAVQLALRERPALLVAQAFAALKDAKKATQPA